MRASSKQLFTQSPARIPDHLRSHGFPTNGLGCSRSWRLVWISLGPIPPPGPPKLIKSQGDRIHATRHFPVLQVWIREVGARGHVGVHHLLQGADHQIKDRHPIKVVIGRLVQGGKVSRKAAPGASEQETRVRFPEA